MNRFSIFFVVYMDSRLTAFELTVSISTDLQQTTKYRQKISPSVFKMGVGVRRFYRIKLIDYLALIEVFQF